MCQLRASFRPACKGPRVSDATSPRIWGHSTAAQHRVHDRAQCVPPASRPGHPWPRFRAARPHASRACGLWCGSDGVDMHEARGVQPPTWRIKIEKCNRADVPPVPREEMPKGQEKSKVVVKSTDPHAEEMVVELDDWLIDFANLFRDQLGIDPDKCAPLLHPSSSPPALTLPHSRRTAGPDRRHTRRLPRPAAVRCMCRCGCTALARVAHRQLSALFAGVAVATLPGARWFGGRGCAGHCV